MYLHASLLKINNPENAGASGLFVLLPPPPDELIVHHRQPSSLLTVCEYMYIWASTKTRNNETEPIEAKWKEMRLVVSFYSGLLAVSFYSGLLAVSLHSSLLAVWFDLLVRAVFYILSAFHFDGFAFHFISGFSTCPIFVLYMWTEVLQSCGIFYIIYQSIPRLSAPPSPSPYIPWVPIWFEVISSLGFDWCIIKLCRSFITYPFSLTV